MAREPQPWKHGAVLPNMAQPRHGMGVVVIFKPTLAHDLTRLFADKTGMWIAAAIRGVLALGLLSAASESKARGVSKAG